MEVLLIKIVQLGEQYGAVKSNGKRKRDKEVPVYSTGTGAKESANRVDCVKTMEGGGAF